MYNSEMIITIFSRLKLSLLLAVFLVSSSIAGINECEKAYKSKNFSVAHKECDIKELKSNGRAKFIIGSMFENGQGVGISLELACRTFLEAARLDYCEAYLKTSKCYLDGLIVEGSGLTRIKDAKEWFQKAKVCNAQSPDPSDLPVKGDYQKGLYAYNKKDYKTALEEWLPFADENPTHTQVQIKLGLIYLKGYGSPKNYSKAREWFLKAADLKSSVAQYYLGMMYQNGEGVSANIVTALYFFRQSADQNNDDAQYQLALLYFHGTYVSKDLKIAKEWAIKSSSQGNDNAQRLLARIKPPNLPVKGDYQKGLNAYNKADYKTALEEWLPFTKNNPIHAQVQYYLGYMYYKGLGVNISHKKAFEWFTKAANLKNHDAQYHVGLMHYEGQHASKSSINAFFWFEKAALGGYATAQYRLAKLYYDGGNGVTKNLKKAEEWATKSANQGNYFAKTLLKEIEKINAPTTKEGKYQKGLEYFKKRQFKDAAYWFEKAASQDYPQAQYELAKLYLSGSGVPRSKDIAIVWFKKATKYRDSLYQIGRLYEYKRKYSSALFWYAKATLAGDKKAKEALIKLIKTRPKLLLWLIIPLLILVKLRSDSKKKVKKAQEERDKKEREQKKQIEREEEEEDQEERNKQAEKARNKKDKKDKEEKAKQALKDKAEKARNKKAKKDKEEKAKKAREDKAKKSKEEELDKYILAAQAKSQNAKLEKARKKLESKKKAKIKKDDKTKNKKTETKKEQKVDTKKPKPKFRKPTKKRFQIIDVGIGGKKWIEWRHSGLGSSDAAKVLSNKSSELLKLKNNKTDIGSSEELKSTVNILQEARDKYDEKFGLKIFPICIQDKRFPWLMATIDGFSEDFSKLVKISCSELEYKEAKKGLFPRALIQHQLMITGLEEIDYWCYLKNQESILITVKRDQKMIDKLYVAELNFSEKLNF
jgi:uncharacterized protein